MNPWMPPWQPSGTVYGTLLNFRREWDLWSPRMTQDPHKAPPKAPVLYVKTANTFCPAGQDLLLQDGVSEVDIGATLGLVIGAQAQVVGAVLLTAGAKGKRRALPNARIMIHQPLAGMEGTAEEIMIHAKEFKNVKHKLNNILLKHTGHPLAKIEEDTDRDRFMSAQEALDYRLIDEVIERMPTAKEVA